jgi:hypothetical protein
MKLYPRPLHLAMAQAFVFATLSGLTAFAAEPQQAGTFKKPGFYTENFHILPLVEATAYYDDNIYATKGAKESDQVALISPRIDMESLWETHSLNLHAGADIGRYADNSAEDYADFGLSGDGEVDLTTQSQLYVGAGYSNNHESRDSKEGASQQIEEPTTYDVHSLQLGVKQLFGKISTKLGLTHEALDYDNVGSLYNDDRDRSVNGLGLRVSHPLSQQTQLYAQAIVNQRDYQERQDQYGYVKDSEGYTAVVGITRDFASGHKLDAYVGQLKQDYDDSRFDQVSELNYGLDFRWYPTKKTQLTGKLDRSLNETTEPGASGYLFSAVDLQIDRKLATDFLGYINYTHGLAEYQDVGREDVTRTVSLGLKYYASPWIMITGSYSNIDNDSNDLNRVSAVSGTYDFKRNLLFLTLRARLAP